MPGDGDRCASLASRRDGRGGRLRHADRRLARPPREHAAAVVGARARSAQARRLQRRRLHRRARRRGARRSDLQGALSERRDAGGPGTAAAAGVFLRLRLAARSRAPPRQAIATSARSATRSPSSSTTPIPRSRIAELMRILVDLNGRLGRGLGDHPGDVLLHQPHAAARGAGELAGAADGAAAAAPHADHLSHQRRPSRRRAQGRLRRTRACSPPFR